MWAAMNGDGKACALLAARSDLKAKDVYGRTALHAAAYSGTAAAVAPLIKAGSDVNAADLAGRTPLFNAVESESVAVVEQLLAAGAECGIDSESRNPLHIAAIGGLVSAVEPLVKAGAELNAGDSRGETPLHYAAFFGKVATAEALLDAGSSASVVDADGVTPLHWAAMQGTRTIVAALLRAPQVYVNAMESSEERSTPLDYAYHSAESQGDGYDAECIQLIGDAGGVTGFELYTWAASYVQFVWRQYLLERAGAAHAGPIEQAAALARLPAEFLT